MNFKFRFTLADITLILLFLTGSLATRTVFVPKHNTAKMSSKLNSADNPDHGNDGNTNPELILNAQCFHTHPSDPLPWWMVDMQQVYLVSGTVLWNRISSIDSVTNRATKLSV
uniref:FTP domain-containing protein n=1 Tax=Macrostomum lignano TaxID=282301 RepID=A0A1I8HSU1_9PLAT